MSLSTFERLQSPAWTHQSSADEASQFSFDLPNRLHCSATYPALASNGSSILVCGHGSGLSILWRGGRLVDPLQKRIESDAGHEPIVASLDVTLDAAALSLAFPPLPLYLAEQPLTSVPSFLASTLLVAITCSDGTSRLVTMPLTPMQPSATAEPASDRESHGVVSSILGSSGASFLGGSTGTSVTYTPRSPNRLLVKDFDGQQYIGKESIDWDLLVACHANEPSNRLIISKIPVDGQTASPLPLNNVSVQTHCIPVPHPIVSISFESSRFPSPRHLRLLVADSAGAVRIAELDPASVEHDDPVKWLGSLHVPFRRSIAATTPSTGLRCRILDAKWVLNGKAVMTLLEGGQWGIWDLEGVGPVQHSGSEIFQSREIHGGGVTQFTVRGFIGQETEVLSSLPGHRPSKAIAARSKDSSHLAPMTPKTRKAKQERLFSSHSGPNVTPARSNLVSGGFSVAIAQPSVLQNQDESIALWYGSDVYSIPSLIHHWKRISNVGIKSPQSLANDATHGPTIVQLSLSPFAVGEMINGVCQLPTSPRTKAGLSHDHVISSERRLTFVCPPQSREQSNDGHRGLDTQLDPIETEDHDMLRRGELDLGGMNRLLDNMTDLDERHSLDLTPTRPRRVGFAA